MYVPLGPGLSKSSPSLHFSPFSVKDDFLSQHYRIPPPFSSTYPMSISPNGSAKNVYPGFDKFSFVRYMKNVGRAYRRQATELIDVCRTFVQAGEQTPHSDEALGM